MQFTAEVPWTMVGNRRCLTRQQLAEHQWLQEFVKRFRTSFVHDIAIDVFWFDN